MQLRSERELAGDLCSALRSFNATFNGYSEVPPYVGYMFEISAKSNVDILTFELDVRFDLNPTDLSIEVYTYDGSFDPVVDNPEAWDQLAGTYLVPNVPTTDSGVSKSHSAMIPASDFTPVRILKDEKRSFYITMKSAHLDHTVHGLQHTGDIHISGDDMQLLVGSGFHSYKFPGKVDPTLNPQFAGVVHYKKSFACDDPMASTTVVDYNFLLETNDLDVISKANTKIDVAVGNLLRFNGKLKRWVNDFGLHQDDKADLSLLSYTSACPTDWTECPTSYLNSRISFHHQNALDSGELLYELYRLTSPIQNAARTAPTSNDVQVLYLGHQSAEAKITLQLKGVSSTADIMDDIQKAYFEETTELFLKDGTPDGTAVFRVQLDQQSVLESSVRRQRHLEEARTLQVNGVVQGAFFAGQTGKDFATAIEKLFESEKSAFLSLLKNGEIRPGDIHEGNRLAYFGNVSDVSSLVEFSPPARNGPSKATVGTSILVSLGTVILLASLYLLHRHRRNEKVRSIELEAYRKEMREQRRATRAEKSSLRNSSVESFGVSELLQAPKDGTEVQESATSASATTRDDNIPPPDSSTSKECSFSSNSMTRDASSLSLLRKSDPSANRSAILGDASSGDDVPFPNCPVNQSTSRVKPSTSQVARERSATQDCMSSKNTSSILHREVIASQADLSPQAPSRRLVSVQSSPNLGQKTSAGRGRVQADGALRASFPLAPNSPGSAQRRSMPHQNSVPSGSRRNSAPDPASPNASSRKLSTAASSPCLGKESKRRGPDMPSGPEGKSRANKASQASLPLSPVSPVNSRPAGTKSLASARSMSPKGAPRQLVTAMSSPCLREGSGSSAPGSPATQRDKSKILQGKRASLPLSPASLTNTTRPKQQVEQEHEPCSNHLAPPTVVTRRLITAVSSPCLGVTKHGDARQLGNTAAHLASRASLPNLTNSPTRLSPTARPKSLSPKAPSQRLIKTPSSPHSSTGTARVPGNPGASDPASPRGNPRVGLPHRASFPISPPLGSADQSPRPIAPRRATASNIPVSPPQSPGNQPPGSVSRHRATGANSPSSPSDSRRAGRPHRASFPVSPPLSSDGQSPGSVARRHATVTNSPISPSGMPHDGLAQRASLPASPLLHLGNEQASRRRATVANIQLSPRVNANVGPPHRVAFPVSPPLSPRDKPSSVLPRDN